MHHCGMKALNALPWFAELKEVTTTVKNIFGSGSGGIIGEALAEYLSELQSDTRSQHSSLRTQYRSPKAPCATRLVAYLVDVPGRLLQNLPWAITALCLRAVHRRDGRGSHTIEFHRDMARKIADGKFLMRAIVLSGILRSCYGKCVMLVQSTSIPPWAISDKIIAGLETSNALKL